VSNKPYSATNPERAAFLCEHYPPGGMKLEDIMEWLNKMPGRHIGNIEQLVGIVKRMGLRRRQFRREAAPKPPRPSAGNLGRVGATWEEIEAWATAEAPATMTSATRVGRLQRVNQARQNAALPLFTVTVPSLGPKSVGRVHRKKEPRDVAPRATARSGALELAEAKARAAPRPSPSRDATPRPAPPRYRPEPMDAEPVEAIVAPSVGRRPQVPFRRAGQCTWPIGVTRTSSFRWCEAEADRGIYCAEHRAIATVGAHRREGVMS
jgi:hypothetical protein